MDSVPGTQTASATSAAPPSYGGLRYRGEALAAPAPVPPTTPGYATPPPFPTAPGYGSAPGHGTPPGYGTAPGYGAPPYRTAADGGTNPHVVPAPTGYPPLPEHGTGQGGVLVVRIIGLGLALLLVGVGSLGVVSQFFRQSARESTTMAGLVQQVIARTDVGDVFVHQGGAGQPLVVRRILTWSFDRPTAEVTRNGTTVNISGHCHRANISLGDCSVDLDITLPPGALVRIDTGTGDITAEGVAGAVEVGTGTGDITLHGLRSATVTASTGTGDITLALAAPPRSVRARTSTGDLRVHVPPDGTAYRVTAHTSIGDRTVRLPMDPNATRTINVSTSIGDLTLATAP